MTVSDGPTPVRTAARGNAQQTQSEVNPSVIGVDGVVGNERLTALAGAALLALILVEFATTTNIGALLSVHVFVGIMLTGPLAVKMASTGYRFLRYYARSPAYVRRGPPRLALRVLAPVLVVTTLVLIGSGIGLLVTGPTNPGLFEALHNVTFLIWLPLVAIHVLAYIWRVPRLIADDWRSTPSGRGTEGAEAPPPAGYRLRFGMNFGALIAGAVAAIFLLPSAAPWSLPGVLSQAIPGPVVVGLIVTALALVAARPIRWR
jgi:hypothetical protein